MQREVKRGRQSGGGGGGDGDGDGGGQGCDEMKKEELQGEGEQQDGVPDSETGRSWLVSQGHHILKC